MRETLINVLARNGLWWEVVRRSAECARKAREPGTAALHEQVVMIVQVLLQRNLCPSLPRVGSPLDPDSRRSWPILRPTIDNPLSRLGSVGKGAE
jgi:hypothetical protein